MMKATTIRPGLLVSLKTSCIGNVAYDRRDIEAEHTTEDGKRRAKWETERTVQDPEEHKKALKAQATISTLIRGVCARSAFGLLCPEGDGDKLDRAIAESREVAAAFNLTAALTQVRVYVMVGRIAPDDVEAIKAINSEVRDLMQAMEAGIGKLDVKAIRDAAGRAKQLGSMLSIDAAAKVQLAVEAARSAARKIVKAGEDAAQEIDRSAIRLIGEARTAFLDLDDDQREVRNPDAVARAIDLGYPIPQGA